MTADTQAVFTAEMLLNIARGSLGGFYIPSDESEPLDDSIFRFTFHGQHPENVQKPGRRLSQEELSMPLTQFLGQVLWIKVKGGLAPTANITNLRMQSTIEDKSNHPSNWTAYIERHYPKEMTRCPFTACLSPITCHIIECGLNNEAFELLMQLSSAIYDIYHPGLQIWDYSGEPGFLDIRYPIVEGNAYAMASLPAVETHSNGMSLERQFHETYKRYWWLIYRGEAFWTYEKPCPLFETYGWDLQMLPAERDDYKYERSPRKTRGNNIQAQLQDLRTIISFTHRFGTFRYHYIILDVVGMPPPKKRKPRQQDGSRKRARSDGQDDDSECDEDTDTDDDTGSESDDDILFAHKLEAVDTEARNITAQMMMIWLANCWSIQAKQNNNG